MKRFLAPVLTSCCVLALTSVAHAGPVEQLVQVALHPTDPGTMMLRYDYGGEGIFVTHDGGESWIYVCNTFIDPTTNARRGMVGIGSNGDLMLGVFDGIWTGNDKGCEWSLASDAPVMRRWVSDITQHPTDPMLTLAVTSNGDPGVENGIVVRDADGKWTELGSRKEALLTRLRAVPNGDGVRYYQSAVIGTEEFTPDGGTTPIPFSKYYIRVSDDAETFEEFRFQSGMPGDLRQFRLQAVDPSNPDRIVASLEGEVTSRVEDEVLISSDRGETFTLYKTVTELSGVVFAPDGRVFIGDKGATTDPKAPRGLWTAASLDEEPTSVADSFPVSCLTYRASDDKLFACQLWQFGTIDLDTGEFDSLFNIRDVEKFASCEGQDLSVSCEPQLCRDYCAIGHFPETPMCTVYQTQTCGPCAAIPPAPGCTMSGAMGGSGGSGATSGGSSGGTAGTTSKPPKGGSGDTNPDAGTTPPKDESSGGGCRVAAGATGEQLLAWLLIAGAVLGIRRRSRG